MLRLLRLLFVVATRSFHTRRDLLRENLTLQQQLAALTGRRPRARFPATDKWVLGDVATTLDGRKQSLVELQAYEVLNFSVMGYEVR